MCKETRGTQQRSNAKSNTTPQDPLTLMKPCQSTEKWSKWPDTFHTSVRGS